MSASVSRCVVFAASLIFAAESFGGFSQAQDFRAATPEELAMKSLPRAPDAAAAILDWVRIDDDKGSTSSEYVRIKVFSEAGKKYADAEIPYVATYPFQGRVTELSARTIRPDGSTIAFDGKVYDKLLYKRGRRTIRAKTFSLPDVQPGSLLEYRFQRRWSRTVILGTQWAIQRDIPILHAKLTMRPYDSKGQYSSYFTYVGLPPGKLPVKVRDAWELELSDIPAYHDESFSPPEEQLGIHVSFYYTTSRVRPSEFWDVEAASWNKKIEGFIGGSKRASEIARECASQDRHETLRKIYAGVQALHNYSFEESGSEQELDAKHIEESRNVEDVLEKKSGFRDEINRAFVGIARAAGFDAVVVRVAPRDRFFFSKALPDPEQISGEIAVVTIDGRPLYLDPGTPTAPLGIVSWEKSDVPGFRVTKGGPQWITLPQEKPDGAAIKRKADLRIDGDVLTGRIVVTFSGQEALVRRLRTFGDSDDDRAKDIREEIAGWFPEGAALEGLQIGGATTFDEPLVATFDVRLPNLISQAGSRMVLPISIFSSTAKNPFAPTTRVNPIYFEYPRVEEDEIKLTLPPALIVAALPPPSKLEVGAFGYSAETKSHEGQVTFHRSMFIDTMLVDQKYYSAVRNFFSAMVAADQKPILLASTSP